MTPEQQADQVLDYTGLTEAQVKILRYIAVRLLEGLPPSIREIGAQFGIKSPNGVMYHLDSLVKKGKLKSKTATARGLTLAGVKVVLVKEGEEWKDLEGWESFQEMRRAKEKTDDRPVCSSGVDGSHSPSGAANGGRTLRDEAGQNRHPSAVATDALAGTLDGGGR